jgi:hypothetical protein
MQAITTKFGAVNQRGAKVTATSGSGLRATVDRWTDEHGPNEQAHASRRAVFALCKRLGWTGTLIEGETRHGYVYAFLCQMTWDHLHTPPEGHLRILDGHGNNVAQEQIRRAEQA